MIKLNWSQDNQNSKLLQGYDLINSEGWFVFGSHVWFFNDKEYLTQHLVNIKEILTITE